MWRLLKKSSFILIVAFSIGGSLKSFAQITPSVFPESGLYNHTISLGPSYGVMLDRNAQFWGLSLGYAYKFKGPWAISPSVAYDQEFDFTKSETQIVNTFTFIGTITYFLNLPSKNSEIRCRYFILNSSFETYFYNCFKA